jgi:hypothetical protein
MNRISLSMLAAAVVAGAAAAQVNVSSDITTSTTWTANNVYNLTQQIYVTNGATLTIEAGTVVASTTNVGGSLAVTRGSKINVLGTERNPVIMTSTADRATWIANNPKTGTWRAGANEWGNLTVMGQAYISENAIPGNVSTPSASNYGVMEGLTEAFPGDTRVRYGGGNDDDDSGTIKYVSLRYGGKVIALNNELNGLSLGGIGRNTDIHHVEVMNNVDDGIEIWGGTVSIKYFSIWNIGDDSFDVDQGWRGKAQFGLLVQGYSLNPSAQGGGVGDNVFEMDGAEDSDWLPVTQATVYNCTVIGQPAGAAGGDHAMAFRDNARVQFRNCIFMDLGERLVSFDNLDGDGAHGYGFNGTLSWASTWTTAYNGPGAQAGALYQSQVNGNLIEVKDSVFYNNNFATAYTEATARGVMDPSNNNVLATLSPIQSITRGPNVLIGSLVMQPVTTLDPRPANDALTSVAWAPNDGFFSSAHYRGAFAPGCNWLAGWTASEAFGFTPTDGWCDLGSSLAGTNGYPVLSATGTLAASSTVTFNWSNLPTTAGLLKFGTSRIDFPIFGGVLVPDLSIPDEFLIFGSGTASLSLTVPPGLPSGMPLYCQSGFLDGAAPQGISLTNALFKATP